MPWSVERSVAWVYCGAAPTLPAHREVKARQKTECKTNFCSDVVIIETYSKRKRSGEPARLVRADANRILIGRKAKHKEKTMPRHPDAQKLGDRAEPAAEGSKSDKVGYCSPPKHSQFKPGQSGNPLGRPKGAISFASELADELFTTIVAGENNAGVHMTNKRAIVKRLVAAARDDAKIACLLISLCAKLGRGEEADPRAAEDEAFVEKLADRESRAADDKEAENA
jgi:hypothetical protein